MNLKKALVEINNGEAYINLFGKKIGDDGVKKICMALQQPNNLTSLSLSYTSITREGIKYLSEILQLSSCKLSFLNLRSNNLDDVSISYISKALTSENCNVRSVNFQKNEITVVGASYITDAMEDKNCFLTSVNLNDNVFNADKKYAEEISKINNILKNNQLAIDALMKAILKNDISEIKKSKGKGIPLNHPHISWGEKYIGETPINLAIRGGNIKTITWLLHNGCNFSFKHSYYVKNYRRGIIELSKEHRCMDKKSSSEIEKKLELALENNVDVQYEVACLYKEKS